MNTNDWKCHWKEMPEFDQPKKDSYAKIIVRFRNEEDLQEFAEKIGQKLTSKTKSAWYPPMQIGTGPLSRWVDDDES